MPFPKWVRLVRFAKVDGRCEECGRSWNDGYMIYAHHILPVNEGGGNTEDNCQMLCRDCHSKQHQHLADFHGRRGKDKLSKQNAYASRMIKKHHNLMRLNWKG